MRKQAKLAEKHAHRYIKQKTTNPPNQPKFEILQRPFLKIEIGCTTEHST